MTKKEIYIAVVIAVVTITVFIMLGFFGVNGFGIINQNTQGTPTVDVPTSEAQAILDELSESGTVAGLRTAVITEGAGEEAGVGDIVSVHYIGVLPDGTTFDSSRSRGAPFSFTLGVGQVIQGWDQALIGAKVGDRLIIAIPPELGYGQAGAGGLIPPNATLLFDVEVLEIQKP